MTLPVKHYLRPNYRLVRAGVRRGRRAKYNWASVDWTQRTAVIAARLGASPVYVARARRRLGKPAPTRRDWTDGLDWHQTDSDLARQVGVSRARIGQVRAERGKRPTPTSLELTVRDVHALDVAPLTPKGIARATGHAPVTVQEALRLLRYEPGRDYRAARSMPRPGTWKYDWDAVDWANKTVRQIARELGCAEAQVTMTRKRLGKPRGPDGRKVGLRHKGEA